MRHGVVGRGEERSGDARDGDCGREGEEKSRTGVGDGGSRTLGRDTFGREFLSRIFRTSLFRVVVQHLRGTRALGAFICIGSRSSVICSSTFSYLLSARGFCPLIESKPAKLKSIVVSVSVVVRGVISAPSSSKRWSRSQIGITTTVCVGSVDVIVVAVVSYVCNRIRFFLPDGKKALHYARRLLVSPSPSVAIVTIRVVVVHPSVHSKLRVPFDDRTRVHVRHMKSHQTFNRRL